MKYLVKNVTRRPLIVLGKILRPAPVNSRRRVGIKPVERFTRRDSMFLTKAQVEHESVAKLIEEQKLYCEIRSKEESFPIRIRRGVSRRYLPAKESGGEVQDVVFTPISGVVELQLDESLVYTAEIDGDGYYALEIDILIEDPQQGLEEKEQFTVYALDNPYGGDEEQQDFEARGVEVQYIGDKFTIDFGPTVTAALSASGKLRIYAAVRDEEGRYLWGDMNNTTPEMLTTITVEITDTENPETEPEDPEPEAPEERTLGLLAELEAKPDRERLEEIAGTFDPEIVTSGLSDAQLTNSIYQRAAGDEQITSEEAIERIEWELELTTDSTITRLREFGELFDPPINGVGKQAIIDGIVGELVGLGLWESE